MGQVYKARDKDNEDIFALKFLHPDADQEARARLKVEAREQATLHHPNVVRQLDFMSYEDHDFILMEYVDGGNLASFHQTHPEMSQVLEIFAGLCAGLECIHRQGLVHRDLKPENVLLTSDRVPKIADLGLARRVDENLGLTRMGQIVGTTRYIAPEQVLQSGATPSSDLYSLGVMLFEALTGQLPFPNDNEFSLLNAHIRDIPPPVRSLNPALPLRLDELVASLLEKAPENRPRSAGKVREVLLEVLEGLRNPAPAQAPQQARAVTAGLDDLSEVILAMDHQIWNPMNGVLGMARLLQGTSLDSAHRQYLEALTESAEGLRRVLLDLLDFARLQSGKLRLDPVATDLRGLVQNVLDGLQVLSVNRQVTLFSHVDVSVPDTVMADPLRLSQILSTLVEHSLQAARGGKVSLMVQRDHDQAGGVALSFYVSVSNRDLSPQEVRELFLPRLEARRVEGLSLYLVSQLVSAMGGRCWAQSFPGRGTAFTVTLTFEVCGALPPRPPLESAQVLVADDQAINLYLVQALLEGLGHRVTTVQDGEQAVRLCLEQDFDLVLMDVMMPGMDGLTATRLIREREQGERTPILALTAVSQGDFVEEAREAGVDGLLGKPVDEAMLKQALEQYARRGDPPTQEVLPSFDLAALKSRLGGSQKHAEVMIEVFLEVHRGQLEALEEAFRQNEVAALVEASGHLLNTLQTIDALPAAQVARNLQLLVKEGRLEAALHARRELVAEIERLLEAVGEQLPQLIAS